MDFREPTNELKRPLSKRIDLLTLIIILLTMCPEHNLIVWYIDI